MKNIFKTMLMIIGPLCLISSLLTAQTTTGAVEGFIKSAETGEAIPKAKLILIYTKNESVKHEVSTNEKGRYYKSGLPPGVFKIQVDKEGYLPVSGTVRIKLGDSADFSVELITLESQIPQALKTMQKGIKQIEQGDFSSAIATFSQGIEQDENNPVVHYYRGFSHERNGELEAALPDYLKAVELQSDFVLALSRIGIVYAKQNNYAKAAEYYKQAVEQGDKNVNTHYNYGVVLMNQGDSKTAQSVFENLLTLDDSYPDALYQLGIIYIGQGNSALAKEMLTKFLEIDPKNKMAGVAQQILDSLD